MDIIGHGFSVASDLLIYSQLAVMLHHIVQFLLIIIGNEYDQLILILDIRFIQQRKVLFLNKSDASVVPELVI